MLLNVRTVLITVALTGCADIVQAPESAQLTLPDDFQISFSSEWNGYQDGAGMVLFGDIMVRDTAQNDLPLEKVEVEVLSSWSGVAVIPAEAVLTVDFPEAPEDAEDNYEDYCYDDNGTFDPSDNEWCAWYYDTYSQSYYEIGANYADAGGFSPNYFRAPTDNRGLLRVFMYVDSLPADGSGDSFDSVNIYVTIGVDSDSFVIETQ